MKKLEIIQLGFLMLCVSIMGVAILSKKREIQRLGSDLPVPHDTARSISQMEKELSEGETQLATIAVAEKTANSPKGLAEPASPRINFRSPEFQQLRIQSLYGLVDIEYATLFSQLGLSSEQLDKLRAILVKALLAPTSEQENDSAAGEIKNLLGESTYAKYEDFQAKKPLRTFFTRFQNMLAVGDHPLEPTQAEKLNLIFQGGGDRAKGETPDITEDQIQQASSILSPSQLSALRRLQDEQQARRQLTAFEAIFKAKAAP